MHEVQYLALLRGVNVGGNSLLKMSDLCSALEQAGLLNVQSYIQSGNVFFHSDQTDTDKLAQLIMTCIEQQFKLSVLCVVLTASQWNKIINDAPSWWGHDDTWKHNIFVMIYPEELDQAMQAFTKLKPEIEAVQAGDGVIYQSASIAQFGRTSSTNIVNFPVYKRLTIRNYRTAQTLLAKLQASQLSNS